jgi:hypothetical protein
MMEKMNFHQNVFIEYFNLKTISYSFSLGDQEPERRNRPGEEEEDELDEEDEE